MTERSNSDGGASYTESSKLSTVGANLAINVWKTAPGFDILDVGETEMDLRGAVHVMSSAVHSGPMSEASTLSVVR